MSNYEGFVAPLLEPSSWGVKIAEVIPPKLWTDALGGQGFCSSPMPSHSEMVKQSHGVLQNVPQSFINQQHFTPALENGLFFCKFRWFLQQNVSLGVAQEPSEGV